MHPWTARYAKLVAIILLYGATVHICNIAGLTGTPWLSTPLLWRCMDIALLIFDIVAAVSLWKGLSWSVWFVFGGIILLPFVPYTLLRFSAGEATPSHFILKPEDAPNSHPNSQWLIRHRGYFTRAAFNSASC